ncbi:MAG TPA: tetratricopeptide repeat protein, partial [Burkholderiaceae bacterium]|nr:tetratricopeptide repeat protein [Burkholderiaceae bacterium]
MSDIDSQQFVPLNIEQLLKQAFICLQAGQLQEAERLYRAVLQSQPKHPDANHNLGFIAIQRNQPVASLPYFKAALEANPAQWQFWQSYLDALLASDQAPVAQQVLAIGMQRGLNTPVAHAMQQKIEIAVQNDNANGTAPTPTEIDQIVALFNTGHYAEVEKRGLDLTKKFPDSGVAWKVLGTVLKEQEKEALPALQKAATLLPDDADAHYNLGVALNDLGHFD